MMKKLLIAGLPLMSLAGCASDLQTPLVFARTQTAGLGIQGSAADQGASLTLGFNDRNLAVVPTTATNGDRIRSVATGDNDAPFEDSLSVLGQFEISGQAAPVGAGLGTFFSTGMASRLLAEGFADRLAGGASNDQNARNGNEGGNGRRANDQAGIAGNAVGGAGAGVQTAAGQEAPQSGGSD